MAGTVAAQAADCPGVQEVEGTIKMRFSVVICTYNYAHLLPDTLKSVAAQRLQDFELLIVDDGSTDNTEEVAEEFRLQFQHFHYLKKPHTGPADTRNAGVCAARGTHIAFVDADDLWSPHYLSAMREAFSAKSQADLALSEGIIIRSDNGVITEAALARALPPLCGTVGSPQDLFEVIQAVAPSGMVFSKKLYHRTGPFDGSSFAWFSEDIDWALRALMAGAFCVCMKQRLYLYRRHAHNLTNKASNSFRSWLKIYSQTLREGRQDPQVEALARGIIRSHSVRFLPTCATSESRPLLRHAIETLGGDLVVRLCYIGTFLGLVSLLKLLKQTRRLLHRLTRKKLKINLGASSESIFEALSQ
jgi:glycosyltransferase involved in cell wall biosynthesis